MSSRIYSFGDVLLVPFPFTDQSGTKQRPAVVVSSNAYNSAHIDLIIMPITSHSGTATRHGEVTVSDWAAAGLLKPSVVKPIFATLERRLIRRQLGSLQPADQSSLKPSYPLYWVK